MRRSLSIQVEVTEGTAASRIAIKIDNTVKATSNSMTLNPRGNALRKRAGSIAFTGTSDSIFHFRLVVRVDDLPIWPCQGRQWIRDAGLRISPASRLSCLIHWPGDGDDCREHALRMFERATRREVLQFDIHPKEPIISH